jgi:glycine hydroxymethyltransferase
MGQNFDNPWGRLTRKGNPLKMSAVLNSGVFPGMQGGPLEHVIAAKAVAFEEALKPTFKSYCQNVISNAQVMANSFKEKGYKVISDGTVNHSMLIDLRSKDVTGKDAENLLQAAHITTNKNMVPFDDQSPMVTSGLRIGSAAITTRGLTNENCVQIVEWIDDILTHKDDATVTTTRHKVHALMSLYPLYPEID